MDHKDEQGNPIEEVKSDLQLTDLGIVELEERIEFTIDPLLTLMSTPSLAPPNTNCGGNCHTNIVC